MRRPSPRHRRASSYGIGTTPSCYSSQSLGRPASVLLRFGLIHALWEFAARRRAQILPRRLIFPGTQRIRVPECSEIPECSVSTPRMQSLPKMQWETVRTPAVETGDDPGHPAARHLYEESSFVGRF